jgi:hypothetical protein
MLMLDVDVGCWMLMLDVDVGCWMLDAGCWMLNVECWMLDVGCWMLDVGCWMLDVGLGAHWERLALLRGALAAIVIMCILVRVSLAEWLANATRKFGHPSNGGWHESVEESFGKARL